MLGQSMARTRGLQLAVGGLQSSSSSTACRLDMAKAGSSTQDCCAERPVKGIRRRILPSRYFSSSSAHRADTSSTATEENCIASPTEESDVATPPPKRPIAGSYLEAIFDAPNAFERDEDVLGGRPYETHNREWVINSDMFRQHRAEESELNQEWDAEPKYPNTSRPTRRGLGPAPHLREKREAMTMKEKSVYSRIFDDLFTYDTPYAGGASTDALLNSSLFGNFAGNKNEQKLHAFYRKSVIQRKQMREGIVPKLARKTKFATGLMHELLDVDGVTEANVNERLDVAKVQLQACQSQSAVWNWADANVWPAKTDELDAGTESTVDATIAKDSGPAEGSIAESDNTPPAASIERPFGIRTPLYAPVLFMMFTELRDRFRAPHAALAVLRNARNLGPESMVLGCTSDLYAEAIRTSWYVLNDLQGACDLVREARDTGILSGPTSPYLAQRFAQDHGTSSISDSYETLQDASRIAKVVDSVKQDVRRNAFRAQQAMGIDKQSHLLNHQIAVASEMMQIVAPAKSSQGQTKSEHAGKGRSFGGQYGGREDDRKSDGHRPWIGARNNGGPRLLTKASISPRSVESMRSTRPWHEHHAIPEPKEGAP